MRYYIGDFGPEPFTLVDEKDNPINLTGRTTQWHFKNRDGTVPASTPLAGTTIGDPSAGQVTFDVPTSLTTAKIKYSTAIKILEGAIFIKSSETPIQVDVDTIEGS